MVRLLGGRSPWLWKTNFRSSFYMYWMRKTIRK